MDRFILIGISIFFLLSTITCVSTGTSCDSSQRGGQASNEYNQQLEGTLKIIETHLTEKVRFYQTVSYDLYESGAIRKITITTNWTDVISFGIGALCTGRIIAKVIGNPKVLNALKSIMESDHFRHALKLANAYLMNDVSLEQQVKPFLA